MGSRTRISVRISPSTKRALGEYVEANGLTQGYVIEQALRNHLRALKELPAEVITPTRIVVSRQSEARVLERIAKPGRPSPALRKLFGKRSH